MSWRISRECITDQVDDHVFPVRQRLPGDPCHTIVRGYHGPVYIFLRGAHRCGMWRCRPVGRGRVGTCGGSRRDVSTPYLRSSIGGKGGGRKTEVRKQTNTGSNSALIAVAAYFLGGCAYQRTVMHQRGWRQCPNYSLWAGMFDFLKVSICMLNPLRWCRSRARTRPNSWRRGPASHREFGNAKLPISRMD